MNKRIHRLNTAKRLIEAKPDASPEEIAAAVRNIERSRKRDPFRSIGELLRGYKRK